MTAEVLRLVTPENVASADILYPSISSTLLSMSVMLRPCLPSHHTSLKVVATSSYRKEKSMDLVSHLAVDLICVDDVGGSFQSYYSSSHSGTVYQSISNVFTCNVITLLFRVLFPNRDISFLSEN